jgi:hypothetical protein
VELDIVQDADRLDVEPSELLECLTMEDFKTERYTTLILFEVKKMTKESIKKSDSPTFNHFMKSFVVER